MRRSFVQLLTAFAVLALAACGGGGGSNSPIAPPSNPNAYPTAMPAAGDYFVYSSSVTPTLPAGSPPTERTVTRNFLIVNADGSLTRADTVSTFNSLASRAYSADSALVSYTSGTLLCTFAPAYRSTPPRTSVVGDAYVATSTESCATQPAGSPTTVSLSDSGNAQAVETKTIPIGTFTAFKYTQTLIATSSTSATTTVETCWIDKTTGRTVECTSTYSTIPTGQATVTASGSTLFRLEAYSFNGQAPVGAAVRRFAGYWNVVFGGSSTGDCSNLIVDINGQVSGSCRFLTSVGVYAPSFTASGTVTAAGAANLTATTGATMSGTFTSPGAASGSWTNGSASGTWAATHI